MKKILHLLLIVSSFLVSCSSIFEMNAKYDDEIYSPDKGTTKLPIDTFASSGQYKQPTSGSKYNDDNNQNNSLGRRYESIDTTYSGEINDSLLYQNQYYGNSGTIINNYYDDDYYYTHRLLGFSPYYYGYSTYDDYFWPYNNYYGYSFYGNRYYDPYWGYTGFYATPYIGLGLWWNYPIYYNHQYCHTYSGYSNYDNRTYENVRTNVSRSRIYRGNYFSNQNNRNNSNSVNRNNQGLSSANATTRSGVDNSTDSRVVRSRSSFSGANNSIQQRQGATNQPNNSNYQPTNGYGNRRPSSSSSDTYEGTRQRWGTDGSYSRGSNNGSTGGNSVGERNNGRSRGWNWGNGGNSGSGVGGSSEGYNRPNSSGGSGNGEGSRGAGSSGSSRGGSSWGGSSGGSSWGGSSSGGSNSGGSSGGGGSRGSSGFSRHR